MNPRAGPDPGAEASVAWPDLRGRLDQVGTPRRGARGRGGGTGTPCAPPRGRARGEEGVAAAGRGAGRDEAAARATAGARGRPRRRRRAAEGVERQKEQMQAQIKRVLPLSRALAAAHRQVQEAKELNSMEKARLGDLQRLLRTRQQSMVAQVTALYPVRVFRELPVAQNHHSHTNGESRTPLEENGALPHENGNGTHLLGVIKSPHAGPFMFFGWQIRKPKTK